MSQFRFISVVFSVSIFLILGAGCKGSVPKSVSIVERCGSTAVFVPEFERIFGTGNMTPTEYVSSDPYRTGENSCAYFGTVMEDKMNYLITIATVLDAKQDYFNWEKTEAEVNKTFVSASENSGLPPGSFYKKLAILPEINFGRARKQEFSWSLVVHSGGVTYSVNDVPQFAGMGEAEILNILGATINSVTRGN